MMTSPEQNIDWGKSQEKITRYVEDFLLKIEWNYGDNRAPIKYPPIFSINKINETGKLYRCVIQIDLGDDEELLFQSDDPEQLFHLISDDFKQRFTFPE
jgi:hypothetical protein